MASTVQRASRLGLVSAPPWLHGAVMYECMMGSVAYGVSEDNSDVDVYGFCMPKKELIFPHLAGEILGFGRETKRFEQWQQHHVNDAEACKQYDFSIYSIVKYFQLAMENNPNMVDSLFVPEFCVLHTTRVGNMVREKRRLFLHKGSWHKFKGYAYSQMHKAGLKTPQAGSKRAANVEAHGWDTKFGYHVVRLISEVEQILEDGDLDLQRNREQLKAIRRGEMRLDEVQRWFYEKEQSLEKLYAESKLRHSPDEPAIKQLLLDCIEDHYGSLDGCVANPDAAVVALREIQAVIEKNRGLL
jgi:predicted nucleotidyltransferase